MNKEIADIILSKIDGLAWVDKTAGLVRTSTIHQPSDKGTIKKSFPVACDSNNKVDLIPDSKKLSVMYFEDLGVNILGSDDRYINCESNLRLVVWLNGKRLGYDGCGISSIAIMSILKVFAGLFNPFNQGNFVKVKISGISELPKDASIFGKYTYDEAQTQYLMFPYDYFALQVKTSFSIAFNCLTDFEILPEQC